MPDTRSHRGPHPEDHVLFAADQWPQLRAATADLSWLLSRDYAPKSAAELVGNRYQLTVRQRNAVERCACAPQTAQARAARCVPAEALRGASLWLDGYNVLMTVEVALGGGVVLAAMDGTYRDIASIHGTYRAVEETLPALQVIGEEFVRSGSGSWTWFLDQPVSNSGRLRGTILAFAREKGWRWEVELVPNPDAVLASTTEIIATADSVVLDRCGRWYNLSRVVVERLAPRAMTADLAG